jgi:hypothetical protein
MHGIDVRKTNKSIGVFQEEFAIFPPGGNVNTIVNNPKLAHMSHVWPIKPSKHEQGEVVQRRDQPFEFKEAVWNRQTLCVTNPEVAQVESLTQIAARLRCKHKI